MTNHSTRAIPGISTTGGSGAVSPKYSRVAGTTSTTAKAANRPSASQVGRRSLLTGAHAVKIRCGGSSSRMSTIAVLETNTDIADWAPRVAEASTKSASTP